MRYEEKKNVSLDYYGSMLLSKPLALLLLSTAALAASTGNAQTSEPDAAPVEVSSSALNSELFYQLLLGELNVQSDDPASAYPYLLDAALRTGDAKLYQRAVEVALQARSGESALQAARAWRQALPNSREANRFVLQILIGLNRLAETAEPLKRELSVTQDKDRPIAIAVIPRYFARATNKKLAATIVEQALADQLSNAATGVVAWTTIGRMRMEAGDSAGALEAAQRAYALDPESEGPSLLALVMMNPKVPQAEAIVRKYLEGSQALPTVRLDYARVLIGAQRYAEAVIQLNIVTSTQPDEAQAWLILGTLELQDKKWVAAEKSLKRYVELAAGPQANSPRLEKNQGLVQSYLALAQIAEQRGDLAQAQAWLDRIDNAQDMLSVQSRRAAIMARQGKLDEARKLIRDLPEMGPVDARMKLSAEVQLLRDNKLFGSAYELLAEATARNPQDVDLIYEQAMLAEKLGKMDEMESLLRRVIAIKPEYHHAYNALGYSLAARNVRLPEAKQLVLKSLEYAPGDPFISDSLGWVEFRSGNLAEALRILQAAYKDKVDAEIAAHLGEVLWVMGKREQALAVWKEGFNLDAENETLMETLKRLRVKL
jgi:predicted Zn-dependent protease